MTSPFATARFRGSGIVVRRERNGKTQALGGESPLNFGDEFFFAERILTRQLVESTPIQGQERLRVAFVDFEFLEKLFARRDEFENEIL